MGALDLQKSVANRKHHILLVDDDDSLLRLVTLRLESQGFKVSAASSANQALRLMYNTQFDLVLSDIRMPGMDGIALFDEVMNRYDDIPLILMTAHGTIQDAVLATQKGVFGFLTKPLDHDELNKLIDRAIESNKKVASGEWSSDIVTRSPEMLRLLNQAQRIATKNVNVLINGASGTGKELFASAIHKASTRSDKPFVTINCASIPENLLESELFGHNKGAFTGAIQSNLGLFRQADGGTLFLDEIGDMPLSLQAKVLRAIQEQTVRPVGSTTDIKVDVRIISATHKDLKKEMLEKTFREDLYYRLNVVNLKLPLLKERFEDVPLLAEHLLKVSAAKHQVSVSHFSDDALNLLSTFDWPGNVRQLFNVIEQCVALTSTPIISKNLVEEALAEQSKTWPTLTEARDDFEHQYLSRILKATDGNVTRASEIAGRNRTDMHKLMKKHGLVAAEFRHNNV